MTTKTEQKPQGSSHKEPKKDEKKVDAKKDEKKVDNKDKGKDNKDKEKNHGKDNESDNTHETTITVIAIKTSGNSCPYCGSRAPPMIQKAVTPDAMLIFWICLIISVLTLTFILCWCFLPLCLMRREVLVCPSCGAIRRTLPN